MPNYPKQNLGVRVGDLLDCRNDTQCKVGDVVYVILASDPARHWEEYLTQTEEYFRMALGGSWNGLHKHQIGRGRATEADTDRCAVEITELPSDL